MRALLLALALLLAPAVAQAADSRPGPSLGTLAAADTLSEWEAASFQLTLMETVGSGIAAAILTPLTISWAANGLPEAPDGDERGFLVAPVFASFSLGSVIVGAARGVHLRRYRRAKAAALAEGREWIETDLREVRRWQATENRAIAVGMLVWAGVSAALLTAWNLSNAQNVVGERFHRGMQVIFAVNIGVDLAAGLTQNAMGRRELYWLEREAER